ncbi:hypothetical protein Tcan_04014 [Toxocara canis]|uniref:Uncharacterized protein n=1 Tax=Toxocara canis TaxID=6265 RepID=A0A0B2UVM8_TOXCA|nr:hypothetical protein Tcan_04014 [Toxocara canis]
MKNRKSQHLATTNLPASQTMETKISRNAQRILFPHILCCQVMDSLIKNGIKREREEGLSSWRIILHQGPDLRFHNDAARLIDQVHLANIDPDRPNVLFALEEHLTEETRLMLRSERENHPGNTAEIFCKALLSVARMVLSAMQSPREEPADSEQTNEQELPVPICCDASDLLIGSNFVSIVNLRVIQHLDSGFTVYDSGLGPLTGGCGHVPAPFNAKWQLHTAFVLRVRRRIVIVANNTLPGSHGRYLSQPTAVARQLCSPSNITALTSVEFKRLNRCCGSES